MRQVSRALRPFNVWSYYHTSGSDFLQADFTKCGPIFHRICGKLNLSTGASGTLDRVRRHNSRNLAFAESEVDWAVAARGGSNFHFSDRHHD